MNENILPIGALLASSPPVLSDDDAVALARDLYGIDGKVRRLTSERDTNFHLLAVDGRGYVLKVANAAEPADITNFQTEALLHIERKDPSIPVPRVVRMRNGGTEISLPINGAANSVVRLLTFLEGEPLHRTPTSRRQRANIGHCLGSLGLVLHDFEHRAADHDLLWDIKNATRLRSLLPSIADADLRQFCEKHLDVFEEEIEPLLPGLRMQVIHNDFNPHNVLVNGGRPDEITGILDFGDMVRTPLILDVAIAASYLTSVEGEALSNISDFLAAYHGASPLEPREIDILFDLIVTRLVTTVAITNWRAARYPENSTYILRNNQPARDGLARFATLSREEVRHHFSRSCGLE
jgi:Ser/Thr protein kinase RdoA (MazF antagonist)